MRFPRQYDGAVSLSLRVAQLVCSALALVLVAASFREVESVGVLSGATRQRIVVTVFFGGPTPTFALLVSYSAAMYTLAWIALTQMTSAVDASSLPRDPMVVVDAVFTVFLLSSGCALAATDFIQHCDVYSELQAVYCGALNAAVAFTFLAFVAFFVSTAWGMWLRLGDLGEEKTPVDSLGLVGGALDHRRQLSSHDVVEMLEESVTHVESEDSRYMSASPSSSRSIARF
ncbi:hypothetical protein PINS_up016736 [Pythium insidiosum]|nr:hypothetical protein PINS_up016736 [Pythium insidiosum]